MRKFRTPLAVVAGALTIAALIVAMVMIVPRSLAARGTIHYGPFASTSPDSGTCGPNWANDSFDRDFSINPNNPNVVTEEFKQGTFVTIGGSSPGACQAGPNNGNTVTDGVTGKFEGSFDVAVTGGTFNPNAVCTPTTCDTTAGFVATVYGSGSGVSYVTGATYFIFHYSTGHNGEWKNASANRGGNSGDITVAP